MAEGKIAASAAHERAAERMRTAGHLDEVLRGLGLGWSLSDVRRYMEGTPVHDAMPEGLRGKTVGMIGAAMVVAVERERERAQKGGDRAGARWGRDREYEAVAHERMKRILAESLGDPEAMAALPAMLPLGYSDGLLAALVGREDVTVGTSPEPVPRWHISVNGSAAGRLPTWVELVDAAHQIRPGVAFVLGVPPRSWWMREIASGYHVLHLWEVDDPPLTESWMRGRTPGGRAPS